MDKFNDYFYKRLPEIYRDYDGDFTLKRFLSVLEAEFNVVIDDAEGLLNLIDVDRCPVEYIPLLCETLGVRYEPDIPTSYQRRFLKNAVMLNKRKGTLPALKYLSRELFKRDINIVVTEDKVIIDIEDDIGNIGQYSEKRILERYIKYYIPVFFELESIFYLSLPSAKLKVGIGIVSGEDISVFPKK